MIRDWIKLNEKKLCRSYKKLFSRYLPRVLFNFWIFNTFLIERFNDDRWLIKWLMEQEITRHMLNHINLEYLKPEHYAYYIVWAHVFYDISFNLEIRINKCWLKCSQWAMNGQHCDLWTMQNNTRYVTKFITKQRTQLVHRIAFIQRFHRQRGYF